MTKTRTPLPLMRTFKMQNVQVITKALIMALVITLSPLTVCAQEEAPFDGRSLPEKTVQFSFDKADWEDVVGWFAEQTGLSWQPISKFPKGTFTLEDDREYTPAEALDQLNYALRLHKPPYTIIRNRNQLILTEASNQLPDELIPQVTADELDQRGDYEIVSCQFDLGNLNVHDVEEDLRVSVSQKYVQYARILPALNGFFARGTGAELKSIRRTIESLTRAKTLTYSIYTLKHYDPEQFLMAARAPLRIAPEAYDSDDGTLSISVDQSNGRLFVHGTPAAHKAFAEVTELLDVAPEEGESGVERFYLKSYPITTDPEMARKVVETQLDGTTATIGQNEITGAIVLRGTDAQHKIADEVIKTIQGEAGSTKIVELQNASATAILEAVSNLLNISAKTSAENPNAPRLLANTTQNYIVIHGSPQQIYKISEMITQLDQAQGRDPNRVRTNARVVEMSPEKRDELLGTVRDYWPSTGRKNSLRIIMPDEKVQDKLDDGRKMIVPQDSSTGIPFPPRRKVKRRSLVRAVAYQQIVEKTPAEAKMASAESESVGGGYVPPSEVKSVPGADLTIKATPFGVLIESDDLDALDDLEDIFRSQTIEDGIDQGLTIFYLKYRKANFVKAELEQMFGLESQSSGSGAGGGIMAGIMDNAVGEGTGDLLGGLLGGSSSSGPSGAIELAGEVQIGMSVPLNFLWVSGATASDLDYIQDAIDLFDQPSAPQNPELVGQAYSIPIRHRSPKGVFDKLSIMMAEYIEGGPIADGNRGRGGDRGDDGGIGQVADMMRGMAGDGGGDGNSASSEDAPKVRMSLDEETGQILVIGPEFIYEQMLTFVEALDKPELSKTKSFEILPGNLFSTGAMEIIRNAFGPKVSIAEDSLASESDLDSQSNNGSSSRTGEGAGTRDAASSRREQAAAEVFRNLRNRGVNGAGRRGGGGQRGGGGGQRGGGGGQRGGGQRGGG